MAKAVKIPSLEEMREYLKEYSADPLHNRIYDADHAAMHKEMTLSIFSVDMPDDVKITAWKFCKALTNFAHAPVSSAEYKRMEKWLPETALIDVLLKGATVIIPTPRSSTTLIR